MSRFITLFFFFLLSGCQSVAITDKVYNVKTPQSHIPIALSSPLPESLFKGLSEGTMSTSRLTTYVSYKAFLTPSDTITETPYSYIYFPKPPTTVNLKKQYLQICEMYMNTFSDKASVVKYLDAENEKVIPVYWFNRLIVKDTSCETLIKTYDYDRVRSLRQNKNSPTLVAHFGYYVVRMDLRSMSNDEDLDKAFSVWKEHISRFPESEKDLDIVTILFSAKKVLGVLSDMLSLSKS